MEQEQTLAALRDTISRRGSISSKLQTLRQQRDDLRQRAQALREARDREQRDVKRLEGGSLAAFFYAVTGKKEDKLDQERREAYAAAVKYDTVAAELHMLEREIAGYEARLAETEGAQAAYRVALRQKAAYLKANHPARAEVILALEARINDLTGRLREIGEAIAAGSDAEREARAIAAELDSAEGWGMWDMFGGGLITGLQKHSHLDEAQERVSALQAKLRRFKTELADVSIDADLQVSVEGFLRFADFFWDGILSDWMVQDHIHDAQSQVGQVLSRLTAVLARLSLLRQQTETSLAAEREALDELIARS